MAEINLHVMGSDPIFEWAVDPGDHRLDIEIETIEQDGTRHSVLTCIAMPNSRGGIVRVKRAKLT